MNPGGKWVTIGCLVVAVIYVLLILFALTVKFAYGREGIALTAITSKLDPLAALNTVNPTVGDTSAR